MTPEQFVAVLSAFAAVLGGLGLVLRELREYHRAVNSKMDALLRLTEISARAEGVLSEAQRQAVPVVAETL